MKIIVVLGCRVVYSPEHDCYVPGPVLETRLDKAIETFRALGDTIAIVVVSGGAVRSLAVTEASVMRRYLTERGRIPDHLIYQENKSRNTIENCLFSYRLLYSLAGTLALPGLRGTPPTHVLETTPTVASVVTADTSSNSSSSAGGHEDMDEHVLLVVSSEFHLPRVRRVFWHFADTRFALQFVAAETPPALRAALEWSEAQIDIDKHLACYDDKPSD